MPHFRRTVLGALALTAATFLFACSVNHYDTSLPSRNFDSRVLFIVIHYTAEDFDTSVRLLTRGDESNPLGDVSAHYLVGDKPARVYQLVNENSRAWHAGKSYWLGNANLNSSSIGIEIVNKGSTTGPGGVEQFAPYSEKQIALVIDLVRDIAARHGIRPTRILGHSDIQPQYKQDPGPAFPWHRLFEAGLIPWPDDQAVAIREKAYASQVPSIAWFQDRLAKVGFEPVANGSDSGEELTLNQMKAFQMRYRPARYDGVPDAETAALLDVITTPGGLVMRRPDGSTVSFGS